MATIKKQAVVEQLEKKVSFNHCSENQIKCFITFNGKQFLAAEIKKNFDRYIIEYMSSKLPADVKKEIEDKFEEISKI